MRGLIVSDVDGTLLTEDGTVLPQELFRELRRLMDAGWVFCPASGRQYQSLRRLFAPMAEELTFICENGAVVFGPGGRLLGKTAMPRDRAEALCRDILAAEGCEVLISGENMSYVIPKAVDMEALMRDLKGNNVTVLSSPQAVPEEILKVSAYCPAGTEFIPPSLAGAWSRFNPAVAGRAWLDFTLSDKGTGVALLCRTLGVPPEDVVAFGDNYNDVPMLALAGQPWLMESAAPPLRARFPRLCSGVLPVLKAL